MPNWVHPWLKLLNLTAKLPELEDAKENFELDASTAMEYRLMKKFLEHRGENWNLEKIIKDYEEL